VIFENRTRWGNRRFQARAGVSAEQQFAIPVRIGSQEIDADLTDAGEPAAAAAGGRCGAPRLEAGGCATVEDD
jgi:hypothetical protein